MTHFLSTVKEQDESEVCFSSHELRPALQVLLVWREAVDEEVELVLVHLHALLHRLEMIENGLINLQRLDLQDFYYFLIIIIFMKTPAYATWIFF